VHIEASKKKPKEQGDDPKTRAQAHAAADAHEEECRRNGRKWQQMKSIADHALLMTFGNDEMKNTPCKTQQHESDGLNSTIHGRG